MNKLVGTFYLSVIFAVFLNEVIAKPQQSQHPVGIVNGTTAEDGEFPYMVQILGVSSFFYCGGSIIGDRWILTAGHCVEDSEDGEIIAYGTNVLAEGKDINTTIKIKKRYIHPQYAVNLTSIGAIPYFDIGIFELEHAIPFDAKAQPVRLANASAVEVPFHKNGTLAGWGVNYTWGTSAMKSLQKIDLPLLNDTECGRRIANFGGEDIFNSTHNLCTDSYFNGECYGDSGSPFVIDGLQYGVVSWGLPPCGASPGTLSRLTTPAYREFIRDVTGI